MSRMQIKRLVRGNAIIVSFDIRTDKFESTSERIKFFEELYGRNQIIRKQNKTYEYRRAGILDEMEHMRVANSVFIIMREHMRRIEEFFKEWEDKVMMRAFPVLLDKEEFKLLEPRKKR